MECADTGNTTMDTTEPDNEPIPDTGQETQSVEEETPISEDPVSSDPGRLWETNNMADQHHVAVTSEEHYNDKVIVQFDERQEELSARPAESEEPSSDCQATATEVVTTEDKSSSQIVHDIKPTETSSEVDTSTGSTNDTQLPVEVINPDLSKEVDVDRIDNPDQPKVDETTSVVKDSPDSIEKGSAEPPEQSDFLQETNKLLDNIVKENNIATISEQVATDQKEGSEPVRTNVDGEGNIVSETQNASTDKISEELVTKSESLEEHTTTDIVQTKETQSFQVVPYDSSVTEQENKNLLSSNNEKEETNQAQETPLSSEEQTQLEHVVATDALVTKPETIESTEDSHKSLDKPETNKTDKLMNDTNTSQTINQTNVEPEDNHLDLSPADPSNKETDMAAEDVMNQYIPEELQKQTQKQSKESIMEIFAEQEKSFREEFLSPSTVPTTATKDKSVSEKESPATPSKLGVGIEHLENLVRLMEQLTQLRDENMSLRKTVEYLEDTKSLLLMQNEILTSKGGEHISGIPEQKKVKHYFTDLSYYHVGRERFPSESSDSTLGTTEPGLLRLKKQRSLSMGSIDMVDIDLNPAHREEPIPAKPTPKQGKESSGKYDGKKSKKFLKWERMKKVFSGAKSDQNQKTDSGAITAEQLVRVNSKHPHHFKPPPLTHGRSVNGSSHATSPKSLKPEDKELSRSNSHLDPVPASPSSVQSEPPESIPTPDDGAPSSPPALMPPVVLKTASSALSLASDEPPGSSGIDFDDAKYFSDNEADKSERAMFLDVGRAHRLRRRQSSPTLSLQSQERINDSLTPSITRSSSFKVKSSETEDEDEKLHEAEILSALECYDEVGKLHGERGPPTRKGQRSLGKAAWGKVKDIIHTRKDSIKRRNRDRPLTGSDVSGEFTDGEITPDGPSIEHKYEYKSKGDYLDPPEQMEETSSAADEPSPQTRRKLSIKMDRSRSPRSSPHGSTKDRRSPSQSPSAVGNDSHTPLSPAPVTGSPVDLTALMGGMSEEFNRKMQEWEDRKKGLMKLGGSFTFDEEANKDEYSTKFSEEFIRKMEEWEKIKMKGLSKEKAHPPHPTTPMDHTMQDLQKTLSESFCKTVQEWERVRDERDRKHKVDGSSPTRDVRSPDKRSRSDTRADVKSPDKRARRDERTEVKSPDKRSRNESRTDAKSPDKRGKREEPDKRSRKEERPTREDRIKKHERSKSKERDKSRQRYEKELQKIEKREQKIEKEKQKLEKLKLKLDMNLEGAGSPGNDAKNDGLSEDFKKKMQEWELMKGLRSDQPNELQPDPNQSKPKSENNQRPASMSGAIPPMEKSESETSSQSKRSSLILQPSPSEVDISTQSKRSSLTLQSTSEGEFTIVTKRSSLTLPSTTSFHSESPSPSPTPSPSPNPDTASFHSEIADVQLEEASIPPESASQNQDRVSPQPETAKLPDEASAPLDSTVEQIASVSSIPSDIPIEATDLTNTTSEPVDHQDETTLVQSESSIADTVADETNVPPTTAIPPTDTTSKDGDLANEVDTSKTVTTVENIENPKVDNIGIQTEPASLESKQVQTHRQRSGSHEADLVKLMELQVINNKMKEDLNHKAEDITLLQHDVEQLTERMNIVSQEHSQEIESYRRQLWASSKIGNTSIKTELLDSCLQEINQKVVELQEYGVKDAVEKKELQGKAIEEEEGRNKVRKTLLEQIEQIQLSIDKQTLSGQKLDLMERLYQYLDKVQTQLNDLKLGVMERNRLIEEMQKTVLFHEIDNKLLQADVLRRDMEVQSLRESRKSRVLRRWKTFHGRDFIIRDDGMVCLKNGSSKPIWKLTMHQPPRKLNYAQIDDMSLHFDWLDELKKQVEQVNDGVSTGVQAVPPDVDTDSTSVQTVMTFCVNSPLSDSKAIQTSLQDLSNIEGIVPVEKIEDEVSHEVALPEQASIEVKEDSEPIPSSITPDSSVCAARKKSLLEEDDLTVTFVFSFDENTETGFKLEESVSPEAKDQAETEDASQKPDESDFEADAVAHISLPEEENDDTEITEVVLEQVANILEHDVPVRRKSTGTIQKENLPSREARPPQLPHSPIIRSKYPRKFKADIKVHQLHTDLRTWNATPPRSNIRHRKHSSDKAARRSEESGSTSNTTDGSFENIHLRPMRHRTSSDSDVFHARTLTASSPVREIYLRRARRELRSLPLSDIITKYDQQAFNRESRSRKSPSPLRRPIVSSVQRLKTAAELMHDSEVRHELKRRSQSATRYRASSPSSPFPATLSDKENDRFDFLVRADPKLQQIMHQLSREGSPIDGSYPREESPLSHDAVRKVSSSSLDSPRVKPPLKDLTNDGKAKNLKQALRSNRNGERQRKQSSPPVDVPSTHRDREQIKTGTVAKRAELFQAKNRKAEGGILKGNRVTDSRGRSQTVSGATGDQPAGGLTYKTDVSEKDQFSPKKDKSHKFFGKKSSSTSGSGATGGGAITALCRQAVTVEVDDEDPHTEKPVTSKQDDSGEKKKGKTKILEGNWFQKPKKFFKASKC